MEVKDIPHKNELLLKIKLIVNCLDVYSKIILCIRTSMLIFIQMFTVGKINLYTWVLE